MRRRGAGRGVRRRRRGAARRRGVARGRRRGAVPRPRPVHRRGRTATPWCWNRRRPERRADHRDRRPARPARPGGVDRPRDGVPGVGPAQPRAAATATRSGCSSSGRRRAGARSTRSATRCYATNAFYDALAKVDGYEELEITVAAQEVQRSALPRRVRRPRGRRPHAGLGADRQLARGRSAADWATATTSRPHSKGSGLTARADAVRRDLVARFPDQPLGGFAPGRGLDRSHGGVGALRGPRDRRVRPAGHRRPTGPAAGRSRSTWSARPTGSAIKTVIFDDRIWTAGGRSGDGWRDYDPPERSGDPVILEHRDHVHVDVY